MSQEEAASTGFDKAKIKEIVKELKAAIALVILGLIWCVWLIFKPAPHTTQNVQVAGKRLYHLIEWGDRAQVPIPNSWCRLGDEHWGEYGKTCHIEPSLRQPPRCSPRDPLDTGEPNQTEGDQSTIDKHGYVVCEGSPSFAP